MVCSCIYLCVDESAARGELNLKGATVRVKTAIQEVFGIKQTRLLSIGSSTESQAPAHFQAPDDVNIVTHFQSEQLESPSSSTSSSQAVAQDPGPSPDIQVSFAV